MQLSHKSFKLLITGRSGTGKTSYFTRYLTGAQYDRIFIFDHEGEMQLRFPSVPVSKTVESLEDEIEKNSRFIIFDPVEMFPGDAQAAFAFACEWFFEVSRLLNGTKLFACDELQKLVDTFQMPWELALLLETGRRAGIDAVFISQQPNIIHNRIRNLLSEVVTFAHLDANAVQFLCDIGFDESAIRSLVPLEYIARNLETCAESRGKLSIDGMPRNG